MIRFYTFNLNVLEYRPESVSLYQILKRVVIITAIIIPPYLTVGCGSLSNLYRGHPNTLSNHIYVENTHKYDPDIYGGVQNDLGMFLNTTVFASSPVLLPFVPIIIIDTPLSFAVDTVTLPYTIYYDIKQERHEDESSKENGKVKLPGVGDEVPLNHNAKPSILAGSEQAWKKLKDVLKAEDRNELNKVIRKGELYRVTDDKKAKILDIDWFRYKVRITEGPNEGLTGWVSNRLIEGK
jgi:uncharacterized protein YceK